MRMRGSVASLQEQAAKAASDNDGKLTAEQAAMLGFEDEETADDILFSLPRSHGRNQPYGNSKKATKAEREELLSIIQQKKYPESGTDVYSLDTNDHKIVYLVDHSSDRELYENLREGGDGFGIRKTFEVNSITKDDIREITRNIAPFYDYSATRISGVLQAAGIGQANLFSTDIDAELKRATDSYAAIYGEDRANWPKGRGYGGYDNNNIQSGSRPSDNSRQKELSLVERDSEGKPVRKQYPATPRVVSEARRQKAFAELNKKLQRGAPRTLGKPS